MRVLESKCGTTYSPLEILRASGSVLHMKCSRLGVLEAADTTLMPWPYSTFMASSALVLANGSKKSVTPKMTEAPEKALTREASLLRSAATTSTPWAERALPFSLEGLRVTARIL